MRSRILPVGGPTLIAALTLCAATATACTVHGAPRSTVFDRFSPPMRSSTAQAASAPAACPGRPIRTTRVITGSFSTDLQGSYVMVPFEVPARTTAVRVKYCYDQPEAPTNRRFQHVLDLGLYEAKGSSARTWGPSEFRGWGGSSHPDVTVSPEGFSSEAQYLARPRVEVPGKTTRAFRPGPVPPGRWAVELGVAYVVPPSEGDEDGKVAWRVEIELSRHPAFADQPYRPARYDTRPARSRPGWYAGDLHVHAEHSNLGAAAMTETFDYAFGPIGAGKAGLDFINLSDYVAGASWGEVGRHQRRHAGKLIVRSAEVVTYRGHLQNHNTARLVEYREGPIYELRGDGSLVRRRDRLPAKAMLDTIRRAGGYTQINHPASLDTIDDSLCRGCSWGYSGGATDYSKVDAIEVATGPSGFKTEPVVGPNPLTPLALDFYESALDAGNKIAAVGVSDSHHAGRFSEPDSSQLNTSYVTQSPIGEATTVVYAEELSEPGVECAVEAGHTYAKITGNDGPDLRFEGVPRGGRGRAIFGDTVRAGGADFTVKVLRGAGMDLLVFKDGQAMSSVPVAGDEFTHRFGDAGPGRYRLQLQRGQTIETASSPIYLEPGPGRVVSRDCTPLSVRGSVRRRARVRRGRFAARCTAGGARLRSCTASAVVRTGRRGRKRTVVLGRRRVRMNAGTRRMTVRLNRRGRRFLRRHRRGRRLRVIFAVSDGDGAEARDVRRTRLVRARRARR